MNKALALQNIKVLISKYTGTRQEFAILDQVISYLDSTLIDDSPKVEEAEVVEFESKDI